jgi:hypothetical protein
VVGLAGRDGREDRFGSQNRDGQGGRLSYVQETEPIVDGANLAPQAGLKTSPASEQTPP